MRGLHLTSFPAGTEKGKSVFLLVRVLENLLDIEVYPQSGSVRDFDVAIHNVNGIRDNFLLPRLVKFIEDLMNKEVRD